MKKTCLGKNIFVVRVAGNPFRGILQKFLPLFCCFFFAFFQFFQEIEEVLACLCSQIAHQTTSVTSEHLKRKF